MESLVDRIFKETEKISTLREDPNLYNKLLLISADYVSEAIKKEGGFFPAYEEALVQREERTRDPSQPPRFTQKVYFGENRLIVRRGVRRIDEILIGKAIANHPNYKGNGSIVVPSSQEKGYALYYSDRRKLGKFLQALFEEEEINGRVHLSLKEKYRHVLSPAKNAPFSDPITLSLPNF
ncbi:MAG: hypothetical protein AABW71_04510 [Nanoarchaeota archaeon]